MTGAIEYNEPTYSLEDGQYAFYLDGVRRFTTEEVAILFDKSNSVLLKHGRPEMVNDVASMMRKQYLAAGVGDVAEDLVVIQGRFDVEDLNKVIRICDYIGKLYTKLMASAEAAAPAAI